MFLSIGKNCIETHEEVALAVSFMIIFNRNLILDKEKAIATIYMFLSIGKNCIETHERALAVSFMIIFNRFATLF